MATQTLVVYVFVLFCVFQNLSGIFTSVINVISIARKYKLLCQKLLIFQWFALHAFSFLNVSLETDNILLQFSCLIRCNSQTSLSQNKVAYNNFMIFLFYSCPKSSNLGSLLLHCCYCGATDCLRLLLHFTSNGQFFCFFLNIYI